MAKPRAFRDRWIGWVLARHRAILVVALMVTAVASWLAAKLHIDADLRRLLPEAHPVVRSIERVENTFRGVGSVNVVVRGGTADDRHAFARTLADELDGHELLQDVDYRLPSEFFAEHALYYLDGDQMGRLEDLVGAWTHFHVCTEAPDVCLEDPDPMAEQRLREFVDKRTAEAWKRTGFKEFYERDGIDALVVLLHPTRPSSDLVFSHAVTDAMRDRIAAVFEGKERDWRASGLEYNIVGPYVTKADEHDTIRRDMVRGLAVGALGVVVILYLLFRSFRAVLILLVPLSFGVTWTLAATQLVLGHLNTMTSLISTVVMGMGIDVGIHFFRRAKLNRVDLDDEQAIRTAFHDLIVPLLVASSTTIGAFLIMASSRFPAFFEFGVIAAMGVALCLTAMVTVLPALARLVGIKRHEPRQDGQQIAAFARIILARPGLVFALAVAVTVVSFQGARKVGFQYDGRKLQSDHARALTEDDTRLISQIFGKDIHAGMLVVSTLEEAEDILELARERHDARERTGQTVVADLFGAPDLLPPRDVVMEHRRDRIAELRETIPDSAWARVEERASGDETGPEGLAAEDARMLQKMLAATPFTVDELPAVVLAKVRSKDGAYGLFAYPSFDAANIERGVAFMRETSSYLADPDAGMFAGETTVYATIYLMMREEAPVVLGMAAVLIAALVFWQLRSVPQTLLTLLPLVLGLWWLIALMGTLDFRFTLFNLPLLPAIMGIGVDNGVYLTDRIRRTRGQADGLARSLDETGGAILAATATTAVGFAAFLVADSGGLRGIGGLAVLGICLAAVAAIVVLPTVSALGQRRRKGP